VDIKRINPSARWSDVTIFNETAYFVEVAADSSSTIENQVTQVLSQAEQTLLSSGSDKSRILSVTIYVTDFNHLKVLNPFWENWLPKNCAPSRACIKAELVDPQLLVEIAFVAALNQAS
jgi:enamine deaminase RidA (YjgF/YER057c/UK114 family)